MSLIIAVKSCLKDLDAGLHNVIRSTWGQRVKAAGIETRFFVGEPESNKTTSRFEPDETLLKCDDSYKGLPYKTREICRWFMGKKIDHILLCDIDTYLMAKYITSSGYQKWDYFGYFSWPPREIHNDYLAAQKEVDQQIIQNCYAWASGGLGYFLSRKAATEVATTTPTTWAEDLWVGQILGPLVANGNLTVQSTKSNDYLGCQYSLHFGNSAKENNYQMIAEWLQKQYRG